MRKNLEDSENARVGLAGFFGGDERESFWRFVDCIDWLDLVCGTLLVELGGLLQTLSAIDSVSELSKLLNVTKHDSALVIIWV